MSEVLHLNEGNFDETVATGVTLVDFFATWCGPCKMLAPTIEQLAANNATVKVAKVDVDEAEGLAERFHIMSVPTVMVFHDGEKVEQFSGIRPLPVLQQMIDKYIG